MSPTFEFWTKSLLCLRKVTSVPEIKARCEFNECCLVSTSLNSCLAASENKDELVFFELKSPDGIDQQQRAASALLLLISEVHKILPKADARWWWATTCLRCDGDEKTRG